MSTCLEENNQFQELMLVNCILSCLSVVYWRQIDEVLSGCIRHGYVF